MKSNRPDHSYSWGSKFIDRHPVMANIVIILVIAVLGIYAAYLATALFTKHGRSTQVPSVENLSYTEAVSKLHKYGFKVDIRDSIYRDDVKPGYVIEQFPKAKSIVKPGRKIFLYINAVHPKEVIIDEDNHPNELALKGFPIRTVETKFEELGFKNVRIVKVLGASDRVVKILANGKPVRKMQKVPVNASIVIEVSDGRLYALQDSLSDLEYLDNYRENNNAEGGAYYYSDDDFSNSYNNGENSSTHSAETNTGNTSVRKEESQENTEEYNQYF